MAEQLLTREQVEQEFGFSRSGLRKLVKQGAFPQPITIGERLIRWRRSTIDQFIESKDQALNGHLLPRKKLKPVTPAKPNTTALSNCG